MANYGVGSISQFRKKLTHTYELISTSYHEAGHTLYGLLHHMRVNSVFVAENKSTKRIDGFTHYEFPYYDQVEDPALINFIIKNEICISYAGLASEKYFFKTISGSSKLPAFLKDGSSYDTKYASVLISKFNLSPAGKPRQAFKKALFNEVQIKLIDYWGDVVLIAHALFQKKKLSYLELKKILSTKSQNKKFWKVQFKEIDVIFSKDPHLDEKEIKLIVL